MLSNVAKKHKSSDVQSALVSYLPSYNEVRCQLSRHRTVRCTPIPDPLCILDALRTTLRGRFVGDDDPCKDEPFLLYTGQGGKLLVFCAETELRSLHQSEFLVCDGTFEMSPDTAYQLYTIHGFVQGEGMPLLWALLPNKTTSTYIELFTALKSALVSAFGDIGVVNRTFLTDFEQAAINAIKLTFPESRLKGCSFHFRQAIMRRVQQEGLKAEYEIKEGDVSVRHWIRLIMSMTMLPTFAIPIAWTFLKEPPVTGQSSVDCKTRSLSEYFEATWIEGDFPATLWSHYDNLGPRTTNLAEGWHNGLNSRFGVPHPSLKTFLDWLQKCQHEVQCRGIQLAAGRPPKQRLQIYDKVDADVLAAKVKYNLAVGEAFINHFPADGVWVRFRAATLHFLSHMTYLVIEGQ